MTTLERLYAEFGQSPWLDNLNRGYLRDGTALTKFLAWFDREAPKGKLTEIDAVEALETFRREGGLLKDVSFSTIASPWTKVRRSPAVAIRSRSSGVRSSKKGTFRSASTSADRSS